MVRRFRLALVALAVTATAATAGDRLQFQGPNGTGVLPGTNLPAEWSADKNVAWKAKVTGVAWASPLVIGDKVIVTTAVCRAASGAAAGRTAGRCSR